MSARTSTKSLSFLAALALAGGIMATTPASGGTVYLMNNEEIDGEILDVGVDYVVVKVPGGKQSIPLREVRDVEFRPGESLWAKKLKDALQRAKESRDAELAAKRAQQASTGASTSGAKTGGVVIRPGPMPVAPAVEPAVPLVPQITAPKIDTSRLGATYDSERYQFSIRYPSALALAEPEMAFITFKDERGATSWSFNITYFDGVDEGEYELIRSRAQSELERIPNYRARTRRPFVSGRFAGERTTGFYERAGRAIRHDQVVVQTRRGSIVLHFFSPGATMEENAVPDVDAVIASLVLK